MKDSVKLKMTSEPSASMKSWPFTGYVGGETPVDKIAELVLCSTYHPILELSVNYGDKTHTYRVLSILKDNREYLPTQWTAFCNKNRVGHGAGITGK